MADEYFEKGVVGRLKEKGRANTYNIKIPMCANQLYRKS